MAYTVTSALVRRNKRKCHKCGEWFEMFVMGKNRRWISHICPECINHYPDDDNRLYAKIGA